MLVCFNCYVLFIFVKFACSQKSAAQKHVFAAQLSQRMAWTPLTRNVCLATTFSSLYATFAESMDCSITHSKLLDFLITLPPSLFIAYKFSLPTNNTMDTKTAYYRNKIWITPENGRRMTKIINGIVFFEDSHGPSIEALHEVARKFLHYDRFNSVLTASSPAWNSQWIPYNGNPSDFIDIHEWNPSISIDEWITSICNENLDLTKPAWKLHLMRNTPKGAALIVRAGHWIGDGSSFKLP